MVMLPPKVSTTLSMVVTYGCKYENLMPSLGSLSWPPSETCTVRFMPVLSGAAATMVATGKTV